MADDIQTVTGVEPKPEIAARLCNFATGMSKLLSTHQTWLDKNVRPVILKLSGPWVDLFGYASRLGNTQFNQALSEKRCAAVKAHIATYKPGIQFPQEFGKGEEESDGSEDDNSGYWRAVSVFVYGTKPTVRPRIIRPSRRIGSRQFMIRMVGGGSGGRSGIQVDAFIFQIVDVAAKQSAFFEYVGVGAAVPTPVPISVSKAGAFVKFRTTSPVLLSSFVCDFGEAGLDQPTSISVGPKSSKLSVLDLTIKSSSLRQLTALIAQTPPVPGIRAGTLEIPTGPGLGVNVFSGSLGALVMRQPPGVLAFP